MGKRPGVLDEESAFLPARASVHYAHSANAEGVRQGLRDHLESVAALASEYADSFGGASWAAALGRWHDLGKFHQDFQTYLLESEAGVRARGTGPDHKATGTILASTKCPPLSFPIAGHHGGLTDRSDLIEKLQQWSAESKAEEALQVAPVDLKGGELVSPPATLSASEHESELLVRMLFSTLVDADYLDTERHFQARRARIREAAVSIGALWKRFENYHASLPSRQDVVSEVRAEVYQSCLRAAEKPPGLFRLTVPTGGGKTLSSMAFALRHAVLNDLRRVIVAVPYTTITEQTAEVYRQAFGDGVSVLEHHSAVDPKMQDEQTAEGLWGRLASENWDAPIVVTTTVQLFESLLGRKTSKCRKIHRIARSVVILDEAQALPSDVLSPILDVLRCLSANYGVSIVFCTATQPALDEAPGFKGLRNVREIVDDPARHFARLRRVHYILPARGQRWTWERVAHEMQTESQALAVTNTVADAATLYDHLDDEEAFHLSTLMCGAHRRTVLREVRARLREGRACRLASTQLVEAGVDLDFPLVLRALGPLDRIVQSAGRCNREGLRDVGRVVIFQPSEAKTPPGTYRTGTELTTSLLQDSEVDLHNPTLYETYFRKLFSMVDLDEEKIQDLRRGFRFREVGARFRLIKDDTVPVVVPYGEEPEALTRRLDSSHEPSVATLRALQPYLVSLRSYRFHAYEKKGLVEEVRDGLYRWLGRYDERKGLVDEQNVLIA